MEAKGGVALAILLTGLFCLGEAVNAQAPLGRTSLASADCTRLASLALPNATVTSANVVPAGQFKAPSGASASFANLPAFCRVSLTLTPSSDSDIKSETWLPMSGWNGNFQEVGNGAWNGFIQYETLAEALRRGYAGASTDTGHVGDTASFAIGHPEKLIDFGYRATHETAVQSKRVIDAAYGRAQQFSYFTGCSAGGRQAFAEAQRFPEDFDGIIAGDPGFDRTAETFQLESVGQAMLRNPSGRIPDAKFAVLHRAALEACDTLDGVKDGIISDPTRCKFDPAVMLCKGADGPDCLTSAQLETAKKFYSPLKDPKTGEEVFPGFEPGSELRWSGLVAGPLVMADNLFKYVVFRDPNWDHLTLDVGRDLKLARTIDNGVISPTSPHLEAFIGRRGKLLIYHGWGDQNVAPLVSVEYYEKLVSVLGKKEVAASVRLYMVPAMGHCGGGEGPNQFDALTPLAKWREKGAAPAEIIASQITNGAVTRTRPLCPYPQAAQYKGAGSADQAENFACRVR